MQGITSARNTSTYYGWVSRYLHWFMALLLIGMYLLGDYMMGLDYYDTWYHDGREIHKALGILLAFLLVFRFVWNHIQAKPSPLSDHLWGNRLATLGHWALYGLTVVLIISGYLISTAKGAGIDVFGWFEVPALLAADADRTEIAEDVHEIAADLFILLAIGHAIAALVHHYFYKDRTLVRMFKGK